MNPRNTAFALGAVALACASTGFAQLSVTIGPAAPGAVAPSNPAFTTSGPGAAFSPAGSIVPTGASGPGAALTPAATSFVTTGASGPGAATTLGTANPTVTAIVSGLPVPPTAGTALVPSPTGVTIVGPATLLPAPATIGTTP